MKSTAAFLIAVLIFPIVSLSQEDISTNQPPPAREMSVALFNHHDFAGWTFFMKGKADPRNTWSITNEVIRCTGRPAGYLRTTQIYSNYFLTVEWRFVKVTPNADNSGILINIQPPDKIWPESIQVQGRHGRQGDLLLMAGAESKEHRGKNANTPIPIRGNSVERPIGQWNKIEVINNRNKVSVFVNGRFLNEITDCSPNSGYIGIQSEGGEMEIRTIAYTPLQY